MKKTLLFWKVVPILYIIFTFLFSTFAITPIATEKTNLSSENLISPSIDIDFNKNTTEYNATWYQRQWLKNSDFSSMEGWNYSISGDQSDVEFVYENNAPGMRVIGDSGIFSMVCNPPIAANWTAVLNPEFPAFPNWSVNNDRYGINGSGMWAQHYWSEGPRQTPSVQWVQNFTIEKNLSDYRIESVNVGGVFNVSVNQNVDALGDPGATQGAVYDWVKFYVRIADPQRKLTYELASYKTQNLGKDGNISAQIFNGTLVSMPEELLISFISSILKTGNNTMMVIVGIDIFCEDNAGVDTDAFDLLQINSFYLNFTYEKIIDQGTYLDIYQVGKALSGANTYIQSANLWYKFKINGSWPSTSPNSEFRTIINDNNHPEIQRFSQANETLKDFNVDGIDVTKFIFKNQNTTVKIRLYVADSFIFMDSVSLFIDEVYLEIIWVEVVFNPPPPSPIVPEPGPDYTPVIRGLIAIIVGMVGLAIIYQVHWKYPPKIRTLRAIRRKLNSGKPIKSIGQSESRDKLVEEIQMKELKKNKIIKKPRALESKLLEPEIPSKDGDSIINAPRNIDAVSENIDAKLEEKSIMEIKIDDVKKESDLSPLPEKPKLDENVEG